MDDMESRKFEGAFKDVFADAKVDPSENVWTNIELDLARAERGELKRRIVFYKLLAAASVSFAMCVAGVGYYVVQNNMAAIELAGIDKLKVESAVGNELTNATSNDDTQPIAALDNTGDDATDSEPLMNNSAVSKTGSIQSNQSNVLYSDKSQSVQRFAVQDQYGSVNSLNYQSNKVNPNGAAEENSFDRTIANTNDPRTSSQEYVSRVQRLPRTISKGHIKEPVEPEPDPVALMMARLHQQELEFQEQDKADKKNMKENLWTSVGFSAGAFNTVNASTTSSMSSLTSMSANRVADHQSKASGVSYSAGVSVGTRLSNRWTLQGGVNYMTQTSDYTANAVVTSDYKNFYAGSVEKIQSADADFINSASYNVNNNLQFISLPVQAGYLIVDRKFGVQVNAGVATDLFLQNTLTPEGDGLAKTTQGRGEDSPYRPVNFSGLLGTEFSYRLGDHYRMALNPGIRYPFSSIYKSELGIESMPLTFDVGLKFRYIFH